MSKEQALDQARALVAQAVDIAEQAGIDPALVVSPHCDEKALANTNKQARGQQWLDVTVIIDEETDGLFEMPGPDEDPEQQPAFHVTPSTAELVGQDFERYEESLRNMLKDWHEEKGRFMSDRKDGKK